MAYSYTEKKRIRKECRPGICQLQSRHPRIRR